MDPAFEGAGKAAGIEVWRIEDKKPVKQEDKAFFGKFFEGDSYILLSTKQGNAGLSWDLHFWLGSETSQDESGIAAYKTVELDEGLGGGPIQYRECQNHESALFLSYFKESGMEYLEGGVASGFKHVERDSYDTRLLHLKGKRVVRANKVPVEAASLNTGDVFILDMGLKLFIWNGKNANRNEKVKGAAMVQKIKDNERGGRAAITIMDDDPDNAEFWGALGGQIEVTNEGEDDAAAERSAAGDIKLFRVSVDDGALSVTEVAKDDQGRLTKALLDTTDSFILDAGAEIFTWIGRGSDPEEKKSAMIRAGEYLGTAGKPNWTPITRVVEGGESTVFKSAFYQWDPPKVFDFGRRASVGVAKAQEQKAIDISALHAGPGTEEQSMVDDGSGKMEIWRIEDMAKQPVDEAQYGQFYAGDSYIILYTYMKGSSEEYMLYFWQGNLSTNDEKGASALLAKDMDDEMGGRPVQCRVVQGKEPPHFRQLFKGKMVVHSGGKASGFKNSTEGDSYDTDGISLYHIKGSSELNTYGVQVEEKARYLNSGDCFALLTPKTMYQWNGGGANDAEKAVAANICDMLKDVPPGGREVVVLAEGEEPDEFWEAVGGKEEYPKTKAGDEPPRDPRLFQCSNATGVFAVEEIQNFSQSDLIDDDVMLLDTYNSVLLWVGNQANEVEKREAIKTAQQYVATATDGRDKDAPILRVNAGQEPPMFTCNFVGWDAELAKANVFEDPYEKKLRLMREAEAKESGDTGAAAEPPPAPEAVPIEPVAVASASGTFDLETLKSSLPDGVDPAKKEEYLSDADFQSAFGMSKDEFTALPAWKKKNKKKDAGLF